MNVRALIDPCAFPSPPVDVQAVFEEANPVDVAVGPEGEGADDPPKAYEGSRSNTGVPPSAGISRYHTPWTSPCPSPMLRAVAIPTPVAVRT